MGSFVFEGYGDKSCWFYNNKVSTSSNSIRLTDVENHNVLLYQ